MEIMELAQQLEHKINQKMEKFIKLGKEAKDLNEKVKDLNLKMAAIFHELQPVEYLVRHQNPHMNPLFDELAKLKDNTKKEEKFIIGHELSSHDRD